MVIENVLSKEQRRFVSIGETRLRDGEATATYIARLSKSLAEGGANIAWLCVPPGNHVEAIIEAALQAGLHVVVEKPWMSSPGVTESLITRAHTRRLLVAIHYQYCFLEELEQWRRNFYDRADLLFGGRFMLSRPDRLGIPALDNLGCHLLAMREYAVPSARISEIECGYDLPDERRVWLKTTQAVITSIDFLRTDERLIQRFIARFEAALDSADFPLNLQFAARVAEEIESLKRHSAEILGSQQL